jgi:hypothetical protein
MVGETRIDVLLSSMDPVLDDSMYVFCTLKKEIKDIIDYNPWAIIQEKEGISIILLEEIAKENRFDYNGKYKRITLNIHSSLDAVGLTAAISSELANYNVSANVVAGYFHDHIFIQENKANEALVILKELSKRKLTTASTLQILCHGSCERISQEPRQALRAGFEG